MEREAVRKLRSDLAVYYPKANTYPHTRVMMLTSSEARFVLRRKHKHSRDAEGMLQREIWDNPFF